MADATCSVTQCDRPIRTRGLCHAHYVRFNRTGVMPTTPIRDYGKSLRCSVEGCDREHHGRGMCRLHLKRLKEFGDVHRAKQMPSGEGHWNWGGGAITYKAAHGRVYRLRGPASEHGCRHCGDTAAHWAYDHADPNELVSRNQNSAGCTYSVDPEYYLPLCASCHTRYDLAWRKGDAETA